MLNVIKCRDTDYIGSLVASPKTFACTEAAKAQPKAPDPPARDAFTRLSRRLEPDPEALRREAASPVPLRGGLPALDDSAPDKPYARAIGLVARHWSGRRQAVVRGINPITLARTDGDRHIPCDCRRQDKAADGLTQNAHFAAMLRAAHDRGFVPDCAAFDGRYRGLDNLESIRTLGRRGLTRLKTNRRVNPDRQGNKAVGEAAIEAGGTAAHPGGYGLIRAFRIVSRDGDTGHGAADDLAMDDPTRLGLAERTRAIENHHRGLKPCCGVERCQARAGRAQRPHIGRAIRAFQRPERHCHATGISWCEAKARIVRGAVRAYLANPLYGLT